LREPLNGGILRKMHKETKHVKSAWISHKKENNINKKPWGYETSWSGFNGIHGKSLFIKQGCRTSFKYHPLKSEVLFLREGHAQVTFGTELSISDPVGYPLSVKEIFEGDCLMVQSGCPYRIKALSDCEIIEIGNNLFDKPFRIEDDFGRENKE